MSEKADFIDRKVDGIVKIFGLAYKDFVVLVATLSVILNIYLVYRLLDTTDNLSSQIVEEVRRQSRPIIKEEVEPIKSGVERATSQIDTLINKINK